METQQSKIGIIVIIAIIVIAGAYFMGQSSKNSTDQSSSTSAEQNTSDQSNTIPVTQSSQTENQIPAQAPIQSPQTKCDVAAKSYFDTWQPVYSYGFSDFNLSYKNHYNQNNNSCYVLVNYNFKMKDNSDGSSSQKIHYTLVNAYSKDPYGHPAEIGNYAQSISSVNENNNRLDTCTVSGAQCYSLGGFMSLVDPYLTN